MFRTIIDIEKDLWETADKLRANTHLRMSEYSVPVLGLIFLRFADQKFDIVDKRLQEQRAPGSRQTLGPAQYKAEGAIYLPPQARFDYLLRLPHDQSAGKAINQAMRLIEEHNESLAGTLPTNTYTNLDDSTLRSLLAKFAGLPLDIEGDLFGKIYEYFLGAFAMAEGQRGGEFFTPTPIVKLIVEIIEPYRGLIFDPACGSGGMFVQSAQFVQNHQGDPGERVSIYGQEKTLETVHLCKMNLAVHGLSGEVKAGNSYYDDDGHMTGRFDFVMANPPFNVDGVEKERLPNIEQRFPFGVPRVDNANYLWIQIFYSALNETGRAGFVMPNSASDARASELDIRRQIIQDRAVDVMVSIGSNFFYTVTLPCTLWFFDKQKRQTERGNTVLFIDARHIYRQLDRAHRDFTPDQIEFLANIVRLYRGEPTENRHDSAARLQETFPDGRYADIPGLCKVATLAEIEQQGWSLNPGRYVGVAERAIADFDFKEKLEKLNEELETLNAQAHELETKISENMARMLEEMGD
jgi:type I restriction enzyme M protein